MERIVMPDDKNVFGEEIETCSENPMTGYFRDGCCRSDDQDLGMHVVCTEVTEEFLEFSKAAGNDLSTPRPEFDFPGLKPGDRWCVCALRWKEAMDNGVAPPVVLTSTHESVLEVISIEDLKRHSLDLS